MSRAIFDAILVDGEVALEKLIADHQREDIEIDFKEKSDATRASLSSDDKRNLGKALSGFSNSIGGLLVWGVKTGKGTEFDYAEELVPIVEIDGFSAHVSSLIPGYISPPNDDVQIEQISAKAGGGYLLVWVGASDRRPHMSRQDQRYYRRTGDNFVKMEHYEVEDLFRVRSAASLELFHELTRRHNGILAKLGLQNNSSSSARFPYLRITDLAPFTIWQWGLDGNGIFGLPQRSGIVSGGYLFAGGADDIIHPGQQGLVAAVFIERDEEGGHWQPRQQDPEKGITFGYQLGCDGGHAVNGEYEITNGELIGFLGH